MNWLDCQRLRARQRAAHQVGFEEWVYCTSPVILRNHGAGTMSGLGLSPLPPLGGRLHLQIHSGEPLLTLAGTFIQVHELG